MSAHIAIPIIVVSFLITGFLSWNIRDAFMWCRAWLYVRFFIRYEMRLCAALSRATEEDRS